MVVIKRNGSEVPFNKQKIDIAISKANGSVEERFRLTDPGITRMVDSVTSRCEKLRRAPSVEEIQDMVEKELMASGAYEVAKHYITYRYEHAMARNGDDGRLEGRVSAIVNLENEEAIQENANKNPIVNSTQRDYMASEVSEDIVRKLLPRDIVQAHDDGIIRFHDIGYSAGHMDNCFSQHTAFITNSGTRRFSDFKDGDEVTVPSLDGKYHHATVHSYGEQDLYEFTLVRSYDSVRLITRTVTCTDNHRWFLADGRTTTHLAIGDVLAPAPEITFDEPEWDSMTTDQRRSWCCGVAAALGESYIVEGRTITSVSTNDSLIIGRFADTDRCGIATRDSYDAGKLCFTFGDLEGVCRDQYLSFLSGVRYAIANCGNKGKRLSFRRERSPDKLYLRLIETYGYMVGLYIIPVEVGDDERTDTDSRYQYVYVEVAPQSSFVVVNKQWLERRTVWCLEVDDTHNFILDGGIPTSNCRLVNLEDMLQNGTVINNTLIEKPHSFSTACNIATQVIAVVASNSLGGQTISLAHLAPFVDVSRKKLRRDLDAELGDVDMAEEQKSAIVERRLREEIRRGVQMIQYQILTLFSTNGLSKGIGRCKIA